jgi:hypothetical protein
MDSQDILNLQEAYLSVYGLDEAFNSKGEFIRDNPSTAPDRPSKPVYPSSPLPNRPLSAAEREENKTQEQKKKDEEKRQNRMKLAKSILSRQNESHILNYLLEEGYAETSESAYAIMENMSEDWKSAIKKTAKGTLDVAGSAARGLIGKNTTSKNPLSRALNATTRATGKTIGKSKTAKKLKRFAKYTTLGLVGGGLLA